MRYSTGVPVEADRVMLGVKPCRLRALQSQESVLRLPPTKTDCGNGVDNPGTFFGSGLTAAACSIAALAGSVCIRSAEFFPTPGLSLFRAHTLPLLSAALPFLR